MIDEEKIVTPAKCNHDAMAKNSVFIMMMSSQISDDGRSLLPVETGSFLRHVMMGAELPFRLQLMTDSYMSSAFPNNDLV